MKKVALPGSLHNLTIGDGYNRSMEKAALPASLHSFTFGVNCNQIRKKVDGQSKRNYLARTPSADARLEAFPRAADVQSEGLFLTKSMRR